MEPASRDTIRAVLAVPALNLFFILGFARVQAGDQWAMVGGPQAYRLLAVLFGAAGIVMLARYLLRWSPVAGLSGSLGQLTMASALWVANQNLGWAYLLTGGAIVLWDAELSARPGRPEEAAVRGRADVPASAAQNRGEARIALLLWVVWLMYIVVWSSLCCCVLCGGSRPMDFLPPAATGALRITWGATDLLTLGLTVLFAADCARRRDLGRGDRLVWGLLLLLGWFTPFSVTAYHLAVRRRWWTRGSAAPPPAVGSTPPRG